MKAIEISHMTCDYGHGKGIFDISFTIDEGEVFGFLGPNGAGKTTTIRHLLGFIFAKEGNPLLAWIVLLVTLVLFGVAVLAGSRKAKSELRRRFYI